MITGVTFISGPFKAGTAEQEQINIRQACNLARMLTLRGYACYVPHPSIFYGVYGDDAVVAERAYGMRAVLQILGTCYLSGGFLMVLVRSGEFLQPLSEGTQAEVELWKRLNTQNGKFAYWGIHWYDFDTLQEIDITEVNMRIRTYGVLGSSKL